MKAQAVLKCFKTGYAGQTGIFEFMPIDDELRQVF